MLVDELSVKITAQADKFKQEINTARSLMARFKEDAITAGAAVTKAFGGLIKTELSPSSASSGASGTATIRSGGDPGWKTGGLPSIDPSIKISDLSARTANVLDLDKSETVIGAVGNAAQEAQAVNITTTVELDGDKVGESVNRFNMKRNRITNGMYR